jgi:UDP-glucose-4-epimerase GalE
MGAVLVTGGAGYIGSHAVRALRDAGLDVVILDSLVAGHVEAVDGLPLVQAEVADTAAVRETVRRYGVTSIMHFAAFLSVGESISAPARYYANNVGQTLALLDVAVQESVAHFVFSSTAAVYGTPLSTPVTEDHPTQPINAYGETKLAVERALPHYERAYGLRSVRLRYFNAAGAHPSGAIGEDHHPEIHLIPRALDATTGTGDRLEIFGADYPTDDGTCQRDYVHVSDLADAHVLALRRLENGSASATYNLGNGRAYSVIDVVASVERVTGRPVKQTFAAKRPGDPAILLASSDRARDELGWVPRFEDLDDIVRTAWAWHREHPDGYRSRA